MDLKGYSIDRAKKVDALLKDSAWLALCSQAKVEPCRRQARKYLLHRGKSYRYEHRRMN